MALCPQSIEMDEANQQAYQIDPNFEPQGRPRSCTWPLNRPNVEDEKNNEKTLKIEPTIEESDELTEEESMTADQQQPPPPLMCQMPQPGSYLNSMKQDDNIFQFSSPAGFQPENNLASDFSGIVLTTGNVIQEQPNSYIDNKPTTMVALPATTYQKSSMVNSTIDIMPSASNQHPSIHLDDGKAFKPKPLQNKVGGTSSNPGGSGLNPAPKPKPSSRKNAWGNMSYADLITQAIESSPDKRLTLAQIYDWMVKNVAYFKDKGDSNSSAGWKNSIRHNLSLHSKFKRTQNEGTGKSSWWTINYEAKPGKPHRRRASSMDPPANSRLKKNRNDAKKKSDQCKKHNQAIAKNNGALKQDSPGWSPRQEDDFPDITRFSTTEYRQRTSSNASSIGGPMSPPGGHSGSFVLGSLKSGDFDDDLMGMGSSSSGNMQCGDGNMLFSLVNEIKNDEGNGGYPVDGNDGQSTGSLGYGTNYDQSSIDLSSELEATPNLARLLQQNSIKSPTSTKSNHKSLPIRSKVTKVSMDSTRPRSRANTMPRLQPQPKYDITSPPGDQCRKIASCQSEQLTSSTRNQQQQSSVGCHGNTSSSSPMSFIRHHQHQQQQQQQQQDRQPNNILYSLLNTTQQSSGPPTSMGEPIFTSLQHHHQQQSVVAQTSKPTTSSSSGYPQDNGAFDGFGDNVQYVQVPEECRRPNSQLSPFTRRIPATLPSIQFSDKTVINQDPNLNSHTRQLTEMDCQQQQQQPQQPQVDDVVNHFPEDINLFDSSFSDIGEVDMSALIGDIKGGIEPNDLNKYFNNPSSSMNEVNMEMDGGDKNETTTTVYQSMSSAAQQQQQQQQQMHQQQLQQQQVQRHQQQQLHRMHQPWNHEINQINDYNFIDPPPQYQQLQSQHNNQLQQQRQTRNDQQYLFMTSDASSSNDQHQMMSQHIYDDPAILPGAASVGFGINSSAAESPNNGGGGGGHYNFQQSPQQCYQQVVPQQQHLMMSGQATPISSATNYKT